MTVQKPPDRPRASARRLAKKRPFGAGPIGAIASHEEEVKCRILDALGHLTRNAAFSRQPRRDVIKRAGVDPSEGDIAIRELSDAGVLYFDPDSESVRIDPSLASKKRVREARAALIKWWPHEKPSAGRATREDHATRRSIIDGKAFTELCRRLKQMASDTDDPPKHDGEAYCGWLLLPNADSPACQKCGAYVRVVIDVKKGQAKAVRNRLAWDTTITCTGAQSRHVIPDHFTAPLPKPKVRPKVRRRPRVSRS